MIKVFLFMLIGSFVCADPFEDRLKEIQDIYDTAFAEVSNKYCMCDQNLTCECLNFAYLLGKKQCMDDLILEYKQFSSDHHHLDLSEIDSYSQVEKKQAVQTQIHQ